MRSIVIGALAACCISGCATAQKEKEDPSSPSFIYEVRDLVQGKAWLEVWKLRKVQEKNEAVWEISKEAFGKSQDAITETYRNWWKDTRTKHALTYIRERFVTDPYLLKPGESSMGYIEERKVADESVIMQAPVFFATSGTSSEIKITATYFLEDKKKIIQSSYTERLDIIPFFERQTTIKGGKLETDVEYILKK